MDQKNIPIKNHNKKHHREIPQGVLSLYMSMIFSCSSLRNFGPSRQIHISQSILLSLRDLRKGHTRRFMMEKPCSTPEVDGGISNASLKGFILFAKLWTEPSEHIFESMSLSVGLIVFNCLDIYIFLLDFTFRNFLLSLFLCLII